MRPGDPLTKQRSPWRDIQGMAVPVPGGVGTRWLERHVHDGTLAVCVAREPMGPGGRLEWHLSISFRNHKGQPTRYPTWDEIAHARYELTPGDIDMVMHLPPASEFVACHPSTFHLHEGPGREG